MSVDLGELPARPQERSIEAITKEILEAKRAGGEAILTIGRDLIEAKAQLAHGEWLPWLEEKVEFSVSAANRFMRLAKEWTNSSALTNLGATKALTLLALPESDREQFLAENNVIDMTSRELQQAIRDRDEALAEKKAAEEARETLAEEMRLSSGLLEAARAEKEQAREEADARAFEIDDLKRKLQELESRPREVAVQEVPDLAAIKKAEEEARAAAAAELQGNLDRAKAELEAKLEKAKTAKIKAEEKQKDAEDRLAQIQARVEELERAEQRAAVNADADAAVFQSMLQQTVDNINRMHGLFLKARKDGNEPVTDKMRGALLKLSETIRGCAE